MDTNVTHHGEYKDATTGEVKKVGALTINNVTLRPGATAAVPNWRIALRSHAVRTWLKLGIISADDLPADDNVGKSDNTNGKAPDPDEAEKQALVDELATLGITKTTRTSLENLRKALDEAKAKAGAGTPGVQLPGLS